MRLFSSLLVMTAISISAGARENHCDHNSGKTGGAIAGGVIGGLLGAALGHGHAGNIALGAGGGALAGGVIGDNADDNKDVDECGADAAPIQRDLDRQDARDARDERREDEIAYDREQARRDRDRGGFRPGPGFPPPGRFPPPPPPMRRPVYQCQSVYGRHGRILEFVLVYLPRNQVVQHWGMDQYGCQSSEAQSNGRF